MDDFRFQQELHALKQRVSEMSSKYLHVPQAVDPFTEQLRALEAHVALMRESLARYERAVPQPDGLLRCTQHIQRSRAPVEPQDQLSLPSASLFWQLYNSLRTDFHSLAAQVADVEATVSELEDKVDSLDSNRFTPLSSTAGSEAATISELYSGIDHDHTQVAYYHSVANRIGSAHAKTDGAPPGTAKPFLTPLATHVLGSLAEAPAVSTLLEQETMNRDKLERLNFVLEEDRSVWDDPNCLQERLKVSSTPPANASFNGCAWSDTIPTFNAKAEADMGYEQRKCSSSRNQIPNTCFDSADRLTRLTCSKHNAFQQQDAGSTIQPRELGDSRKFETKLYQRDDEIEQTTMRSLIESAALSNAPMPSNAGSARNQHFTDRTKSACHTCRARKERCDEGRPNCMNCGRNNLMCAGYGSKPANCEVPIHTRSTAPLQSETPEGLAFRDREIARMDDQLKTAQETLRVSEEKLAVKDSRIEFLELDHARSVEKANMVFEESLRLKEQVSQCRNIILEKDSQIDHFETRVVDCNNALRNWESSWMQMHESYQRASTRTEIYERAAREERQTKESEIDQLTADHEKKLERLNEFCEQKDAVIYKQEQMLSAGGKLLEKKDEEIDNLQRELRASEDDKEHAMRAKSRLERLLEERDAELASLRQMWKPTSLERCIPESQNTDNDNCKHRAEPQELDRSSPTVSDNEEQRRSRQQRPFETSDTMLRRGRQGLQRHSAVHNQLREGIPALREIVIPPAETRTPHGRDERRHRRRYDRFAPSVEWQDWRRSSRPNMRDEVILEHDAANDSKQAYREFRRRPVADRTLMPPLPAPVMPRRVGIDTGPIPANDQTPARHNLAKYRSMPELPQRRLQAYVESDAESGEERRGGV